MGNSSSSRAKAASKSTEAAVGGKVNHKKFGGAIGRKSRTPPTKKDRVIPTADPLSSPSSTEEEAVLVPRVGDDDVSYDTASDDEYDSDEESVDEEFDEYVAERLRILADAHALKEMARAYLHPEEPVVAPDPTACARCYFDRASAPEQESVEEAEYRATVLADAQALKEQAVWHAHPELPVVSSDPTATARCYFDRASAPEQESLEEAEYRAAVLADALALKERAVWHAHPELPVATSDPTATARCYFDRASAPEQESVEEAEERAAVLADAQALKEQAVWHAHPELPVVSSDPTATARCYFDRASAPEQESLEEAEYRAAVLADALALKERAVWHAHPELPVVSSDPTATARCYFDRASAPEQESVEEAEERAAVLADAQALKEQAVWHAHPELPVVSSDPTATARCYFDRASAPEQESLEEAEYRATVLADAQALKEQAVWHAHPELPVATTDATATARCYFDRASAPEQESLEEAEYRAAVLADALALKEQAVMYAHSELPVVTSDPTACARCYFDRASAPHDAEQIISTSAYAVEKEEEESLEDHMQKLEALAPAASKVKTVPAAGPEAATSIHRSASEVHLFDLQDTA